MGIARIKEQARARLHRAMSVPVLWSRGEATLPEGGPDKKKLSARWHNKLVRQGDLGGDYADILEGLDRLVFQQDQLDALGITLTRGDIITFSDYDVSFELDQPEPNDGPLNRYWHVSRA